MKDYYKILAINKNATDEEIKQAFREKAKKLHPDINTNSSSHSAFIEVGEAYEILSNQSSKNKYDMILNHSEKYSNEYINQDFQNTQEKANERAREYSTSSLNHILFNITKSTYEIGQSVASGESDKSTLSTADYVGLGFSGLIITIALLISFTGVGAIPGFFVAKSVLSSMQKNDKSIGILPLLIITAATYLIVGIIFTSLVKLIFN